MSFIQQPAVAVQANAVDTNGIVNLAVTAAKIANDTITATQIAADAVGASELANNAVDTNAIANSNVTYAKIQNVTAARLLGNPTGAAAAPNEISLAGGLAFSGTTLTGANFVDLTGSQTVTGTKTFGTTNTTFLNIATGGGLSCIGTATATFNGGATTTNLRITGTTSGDPNILDNYTEGTWTPTFAGETTAGSFGYGVRYGSFTRIGRQVTVTCNIGIISISTQPVGTLFISGMPFTAFDLASGGASYYGAVRYNLGTLARDVVIGYIPTGNNARVYLVGVQDGSGLVSTTDTGALDSGSTFIQFTLTYFTDT